MQSNRTVWADSKYMPGYNASVTGGPTPGATSNAGYGIAHLAAIFPGCVVTAGGCRTNAANTSRSKRAAALISWS